MSSIDARLRTLADRPPGDQVRIQRVADRQVLFTKTEHQHNRERIGGAIFIAGIGASWLILVTVSARQGSAPWALVPLSILGIALILLRWARLPARAVPVATIDLGRQTLVLHGVQDQPVPIQECGLWVHCAHFDDSIPAEDAWKVASDGPGWMVFVHHARGSTAIYGAVSRQHAIEVARVLRDCATWRSTHVDAWKRFYPSDPLQ